MADRYTDWLNHICRCVLIISPCSTLISSLVRNKHQWFLTTATDKNWGILTTMGPQCCFCDRNKSLDSIVSKFPANSKFLLQKVLLRFNISGAYLILSNLNLCRYDIVLDDGVDLVPEHVWLWNCLGILRADRQFFRHQLEFILLHLQCDNR